MNSFESEIAALRQKHAEEMARAEREAAIRHALPVPPRYVHQFKGSGGRPATTHITYKADIVAYPKPPEMALAEALALVETLPPSVSLMRQNGCLSVEPEALMEPRYLDGKDRGTSLVQLVCSIGRGFGPNWSLEWYSEHPELGWLMVKVEIQPPPVRAYVRVLSWREGEPGMVEKHADLIPGGNLISWNSGSQDSGRWSWHFTELESLRALVK